jgi:hypothetical protein
MPENKKLMIRNARVSYVTVDEPRAITEGGKLYYSVSVIIEKDNPAVAEYIEACRNIMKEQKWDDAQIKLADKGIRDGSKERPEDDAYTNRYFLNAKSERKPLLIDKARREVSPEKIYSGCYCNVSISMYPYDKAKRKGVGVGLRGIQFVEDGNPLGSTVSKDEFDQLETDDTADDFI